ncbi:MAG: inositol monophosphatase family protein [Candidatus Thorarchaeota archaeon]
MEITIDFLKQLAFNIYDKVHPLIGTKEGAAKVDKGTEGDLSMKIDLVAEQALINTLQQSNVNLLLISEEIGEKYIGRKEKAIESNNVLIVDPVDGSNNAVRGIPYCSFSVAFAKGKYVRDIEKALVLDLTTKDIYWAYKGQGAYLNETPIHVSDLDISDNCFFELNLSKRKMFDQLKRLEQIIKRFYRIRILGSTALTLCQLAKGSMEAFINLRGTNRLVDVAAGLLILKEAGGSIISLNGKGIDEKLSINFRFPFIASNKKVLQYLKKELIPF